MRSTAYPKEVRANTEGHTAATMETGRQRHKRKKQETTRNQCKKQHEKAQAPKKLLHLTTTFPLLPRKKDITPPDAKEPNKQKPLT